MTTTLSATSSAAIGGLELPPVAPGAEVDAAGPLSRPPASATLPSAHSLATAPPTSVPSAGAPPQTTDVAAALVSLNAVLDSFGTLLLAQQSLRQERVERGIESAEAGEASAEVALEQQREALEATERAQRRARGLLGGAPRWVKKLVAGLITVAGAVAGAFTGGAAAGLAIAGAVLILAGDAVTKLAVKAGMDPDKAAWLGFAVKIVGTALSLGAGAAGGAASAAGTASQAVQTATRVIDTATRVANTASAVADLGLGTAASVLEFKAERASADADAAGLEVDRAQDQQEDGVQALRDAHTQYERVVGRMQAWLDTRAQTTSALISHVSA